jgi:hypothetical protein
VPPHEESWAGTSTGNCFQNVDTTETSNTEKVGQFFDENSDFFFLLNNFNIKNSQI